MLAEGMEPWRRKRESGTAGSHDPPSHPPAPRAQVVANPESTSARIANTRPQALKFPYSACRASGEEESCPWAWEEPATPPASARPAAEDEKEEGHLMQEPKKTVLPNVPQPEVIDTVPSSSAARGVVRE